MATKIRREKGYIAIDVSGEVDLYNVSELKRPLLQICQEDGCKVLLTNLSDVTYFDSSGIGALVAGHKRMKMKGGKFYISNIQDDVYAILKLATLDRFFNILDDEEELKRIT